MSLPKAFLEELRVRVPLSDIVGKRVKLTRAGREFKGCCPFHKEKTPSFTLNDQKGFYHCFGCGAHGDAIGFLMNHDNLPFMEAVEQLASLAGMQVPKASPEEARKFQQQMSLYDLAEAAAAYFEKQLHAPENKKIVQYLRERGLSLDTIRSFRVGFAPAEDDKFKLNIQKSKYNIEDAVEIGLLRRSERNKGDVYPFFRGRVIFPVLDLQGRVVAFGGRVLPEHYGGPPDKSAPKYINSPESPIFHKGHLLYGLSRARKVIGDGEVPIVVEGYMDVIALAQAGFRAPVAPLGTALTESQIETLWKAMPEGLKAPVLCFDGDAAGQRAAARALERVLPILKPDHSVKFAFLPEQHDPDSLIRAEGVPAMQRVIESSIGLFDMMWNEEAKDRNLSLPETKAGFRSALEKRARLIPDRSIQEFFIHEINQKINSVFLTLTSNKKTSQKGAWGKQKVPQSPGLHTPYRPVNIKAKPIRTSRLQGEKVLLALMINYPYLYEDFGEQFGMVDIPNADYEQLRGALIRFLDESAVSQIYLDDQAVKQHLIQTGYGKILDAIFDKSLYLHASFAKLGQPDETVRQGWQDTWERCLKKARRA